MAYSPGAEGNAIVAASIKASVVGSIIWTILLALPLGASSVTSLSGIFSAITLALLFFLFAFVTGVVAIGLCLMLFGYPLARLAQDRLETHDGIVVVLAGTLAVLGLAAVVISLIASPGLIVIVLPYAIPAALFYRSEILLEEALD